MIRKILDRIIFDKTLWKFLLVGIVNTLFGYGIMFTFYNLLHLGYGISSASNYFFGSILSYFLNKYFTFQYKKKSPAVIIRFVINITVCYLIAYGIAKPLVILALDGFSTTIQDNVAMLVGSGFFVVLNYFGQRFFAFKKDE